MTHASYLGDLERLWSPRLHTVKEKWENNRVNAHYYEIISPWQCKTLAEELEEKREVQVLDTCSSFQLGFCSGFEESVVEGGGQSGETHHLRKTVRSNVAADLEAVIDTLRASSTSRFSHSVTAAGTGLLSVTSILGCFQLPCIPGFHWAQWGCPRHTLYVDPQLTSKSSYKLKQQLRKV